MYKSIIMLAAIATSTLSAQTTIVDFEDDGAGKPDVNATAEWIGDPNLPEVVVGENPEKLTLNTSNTSVKFVETSGSNLNNSLQLAFNGDTARTGFSLADNKFVQFMVYSEDQSEFTITLELGAGGTPHFSGEKTIVTTKNTWTPVEFDFSGEDSSSVINNETGWVSNVRVHFNVGSAGSGDTYHVDNLTISNEATIVEEVDNGAGTVIGVLSPYETDYVVSGSLYKMLNLDISTTGSYANLTVLAGEDVIAHTVNLPSTGAHQLSTLVKFPSTGATELTMRASTNAITINSFEFVDVPNVEFPEFSDVTSGSGIFDDPSLKYGGPSIADMDQDGDYDVVLNNHNDSPSKMFWNNGDGTFTKYKNDLALWKQMDLHGSAAGDYDNDGDLDLLMSIGGGNGTNPSSSVLYKNNDGDLVRSDVAAGISVNARGRSPRWIDLDLDNDLDLMVVNALATGATSQPQQTFYENLGDGTFAVKRIAGVEDQHAERVIVTDYDGDHIDDLLMFSPLSLWKGNGDFTFTNVTNTVFPASARNAQNVIAASDIDIDNDGDLDLYMARGVGYFFIAQENAADFYPEIKRLDARLSGSQGPDVPFELKAEGAITISDYDAVFRSTYTGDYPLYLGTSKTERQLENRVDTFEITQEAAMGWPEVRTENGIYVGYIGDGTWKMEVVKNVNVYWSIAFTLDGVDEFTREGWTSGNTNKQDILLRNDGGTFVDISATSGIPVGGNNWGVTRGDFNNDGFDDLFVNRFDFLKNRQADYLLLNSGDGSFVTTSAHSATNIGTRNHGDGSQAFDYDLDGKLDILVGDDEFGLWHLYKNTTSNTNNHTLIKVGYSPVDNVDQYSAEVVVTTATKTYFKRVGSAGASHSQSLLNIVHFGLGTEDQIEKIDVRWRNGESISIFDKAANELIDTDTELVDPTSIAIVPASLELRNGTTEALTLDIVPVNANREVVWASSNEEIATVDEEGMVTGVANGEVVITATSTTDGEISGELTVTVVDFFEIPVTGVEVLEEELALFTGESGRLTATLSPETADNKNITWSSANPEVATVDVNGTVTAVADGVTTIIVTSEDGEFTDTVEVTVSTFVTASIAFDDVSIYTSSEYPVDSQVTINTNFHAGSGHTVLSNADQGIKYWIRHLNASWIPQTDYIGYDRAVIGEESGMSTGVISLENAIPSAKLPDGDFYWMWVHFTTSDEAKRIEVATVGITVVEKRLSNGRVIKTIELSPNPVVDYLTVSGEYKGQKLEVYDLQGQKITSVILADGENNIDLTFLTQGIYVVKVNGSVEKIIKR